MKYFLDESGAFRVPEAAGTHAVGIVSGVVVPESIEEAVFDAFRDFLKTVPETAFEDGEVKGRLLDDDSLKRLADAIVDMPNGILFCPAMLDLTSLFGTSQANARDVAAAKLQSLQAGCKHAAVRDRVGQLAADVGRMSNQQVLRLFAWAHCVNRCFAESIVFHSGPAYHSCWSSIRVEIDQVQQGGGTEAGSFEILLPSWISAWSVRDPMWLIEGVHTPDHPFVRNWDTGAGINAGRMVQGNVHYSPSAESLGIQLADVTATLIRRATMRIATAPNLQNYGFLHTRTIGAAKDATGLFFLGPHDPADVQRRYYGLCEAIAEARATIPNSYCKSG